MTYKLIIRHLSKKIATAKVHLNKERKHLQSTKNTNLYDDYIKQIKKNLQRLKTNLPDGASLTEALQKEGFDDAFPPTETKNIKTNDVMYAIVDNKSGIGYMGLTDRFPYQSSWRNNYLMIVYNDDANAILVEPLKNRQAVSVFTAWTTINKNCMMLESNPIHTSWTTNVPVI